MNARLFQELEEAIDNWVIQNCEKKDWLNIYIGNLTINKMAAAAAAVADGIEEGQQFYGKEL